tara:strand:+ start:172 stop:1551 length:1380 start_codon:yes stop_codon:yes gene_type:complete
MLSNSIINIILVFLTILVVLLIVKIVHIKYRVYEQNEKIDEINEKEKEESKKLSQIIRKQALKERDEDLKNRNINLNIDKKLGQNFLDNIQNTFSDVHKKRGTLHQVSDCNQCDMSFCNKEILEHTIYPEDSYVLGEPLVDWGCENIYKNIPKLYDTKSGKIYVLEKLKKNIQDNLNENKRIKKTIHLIDDCKQCDLDRDWCNKDKFVLDKKYAIDHYNVGVSVKELGCANINKDLDVIHDKNTDNIYVVGKDQEKYYGFGKHGEGICQSKIIGSMENPNIDLCFNRCSKERNCNYVSYDKNICNRYEKCQNIKKDDSKKYETYKKNNLNTIIIPKNSDNIKDKEKNKQIIEKNKDKIEDLKNNINNEPNIIDKFKNFWGSKQVKIDKYDSIKIEEDQKLLIKLLENNEDPKKIKLLEDIIQNKKDLKESVEKENYELSNRIHDKLITNQRKYKEKKYD